MTTNMKADEMREAKPDLHGYRYCMPAQDSPFHLIVGFATTPHRDRAEEVIRQFYQAALSRTTAAMGEDSLPVWHTRTDLSGLEAEIMLRKKLEEWLPGYGGELYRDALRDILATARPYMTAQPRDAIRPAPSGELFGMKVVTDERVPADEVWVSQNNEIVGKVINAARNHTLPAHDGLGEDEEGLTIKDYEEVLADKRRLTRELDVALHGEEGAAQQASLCDLIQPAKRLRVRVAKLEAALRHALKLLEPFDDDELSLGLGKDALTPIREALAQKEGV